ncbi:MAG TPA: hypothetical protein VGH23_06725 [Rhizomicrobium sp.]|jgi:hypothetical protein
MWPFGKKIETQETGAVVKKAELEKLGYETICTICLERYPPGMLLARYPTCPDCDSEGMGIFVEKFDEYMAGKNAQYFDDMLKWWESKEGFRPEYKALKTRRIVELRDRKLG